MMLKTFILMMMKTLLMMLMMLMMKMTIRIQEGLMEGLKSWLGFAGSMTGTGTTAISGKTHHKDDNSDYC